jgi:hypothetical protein
MMRIIALQPSLPSPPTTERVAPPIELSVMFLAGGDKKGIKLGHGEGLPDSITVRRGACLTRRREGGPRGAVLGT